MRRMISIETYRILLMAGICFLHSICQTGHNTVWLANIFECCVCGFVFISGYFGIKFNWRKVVGLWMTAFYASAVFAIFDSVFGNNAFSLVAVYKRSVGFWFLNAYVILMCFAPIINLALDSKKDAGKLGAICMPIIAVIFGWGFLRALPFCDFVPFSEGLCAYGALTLIGIYIVARLYRKFNVGQRIGPITVFVVMAISIVCTAMGAGDYNSPFAVLLAASVFYFFERVDFGNAIVSRIVMVISPSLFSVYLLHSHSGGFGYMSKLMEYLLGTGVPLLMAYVIVAVVVFSICLLCDVPRRLVREIWRKRR